MCSIGEDDFGDDGGVHAMVNDEQLQNSSIEFGTCQKCGTKAELIKLKFREPECPDCFLAYTRHKFRAALGSSKILPKGADVLLIFDGGATSIALLHMMHYAQSQDTFKRLHVNTKVIFIDERLATDSNNIIEIQELLSKYDFETFAISLWKAYPLCKLSEKHPNVKETDFATSVKSIKTLTSRQDFIKIEKNRVIEAVANELKCDFVFLPNVSTDLAMELLNSISLGRGASAATEVSLLDDRFQGLKIIRPLRNLNTNEVNLYLQVNKLKPIRTIWYGEECGSSSSIQNLTRLFVENLQANYSSTISTVFRTGDKISANTSNSVYDCRKCSFCSSPLQATSKTLIATEFSRITSSLCGNLKDAEGQTMAVNNLSLRSKTEQLCHACNNIKNDCENVNILR